MSSTPLPNVPSKPTTTTTPTTKVAVPSVDQLGKEVQTKLANAGAALSPSGSKPTMIKTPPPFKMERPSTATSRWLNMMAYGKPGSGKTTLLGTASNIPEMLDILYIDAERGNLTMEENPRIKESHLLTDNRVSVETFKEVALVHDFLKAHCKHRDEGNVEKLRALEAKVRGCDISEIDEPKRFRTVLMDSLTEIDIYCTYGLLGITQQNVLHGEASDIEVARFDEFRKNNQMVQMLCRAFRDLPIHFLASAGRVYTEDELKKRYYSPALTGQLKTQVPGFFDIVGYLDAAKVGDVIERRMYVKPVGNFEAKNRRSVFQADFFKDPYMADIMKGVGLLKPPAPKGD